MTIQMDQKYNSSNGKSIHLQIKQPILAENVPKLLFLNLEKVDAVPPKMLKVPTQNFENKKTNLLGTPNPIHIPKLVDLRIVLKQAASDNINLIPKLLTLPKIEGKIKFVDVQQSKQELNIDHILKQNKVVKKHDIPTYKAINLRPSQMDTIAINKPLKLLSYPETIQINKSGLNEANKFNNQGNQSLRNNQDFYNQSSSLNPDEVSEIKSKKQIEKVTSEKETPDSDNEDKLYNALSNLFLRRKNKKIKKKSVRLIDIIDRIPLSSESEEEETFQKKLHHCNCPVKTSETPNISENVFHNTFQKDSSSAQIQNNHFSKILDPSDDPFSWLNIIRAARLDTKHTQTDKLLPSVSILTKECQTELKEMIEIPRTLTFLDQHPFKNVITEENIEINKNIVENQTEFSEDIAEQIESTNMPVVTKSLPLSENDSSTRHIDQNGGQFIEKVDPTLLYNAIPNSEPSIVEKNNCEKCQTMQSLPLIDTPKFGANKKFTKMLSKTDERTWLKENLSGFSSNLKALEDLHHNLETELYKTKFYSTDNLQIRKDLSNGFTPNKPKNFGEQCSGDLQDDDFNVICKIKDQSIDFQEKRSFETFPISSSNLINFSKKMFLKSRKEKFDLSSFSKSYEDGNEDEMHENEQNNLEDEKKKQDDLFKEEIRKKLRGKKFISRCISPAEEKSDDHADLLSWMQTKQSEKLAEYKIQLDKQHSTEHKPYVKSLPQNEVLKNTYMVANKTRNIFEDNNAERMLQGEKLARAVISSNLNTKTKDTTTKQKLNNNRKITKIPVKDTQSSRLRKNALLINVINLKKLRNTKFVKKPIQIKKENLSEENTPNLQVSPIRPADPQTFITKKSYDLYKAKSAKRQLDRSVDDLSNVENTNDSLLDAYKFGISPRRTDQIPTFYKKPIDKLTFKYPVDTSSETMQLLAEAEMALMDEKEPTINGLSDKLPESIDWNEVEKILNTP